MGEAVWSWDGPGIVLILGVLFGFAAVVRSVRGLAAVELSRDAAVLRLGTPGTMHVRRRGMWAVSPVVPHRGLRRLTRGRGVGFTIGPGARGPVIDDRMLREPAMVVALRAALDAVLRGEIPDVASLEAVA